MIVKMNIVYGLDNHTAYYRKNGDCFDFVTTPSLASDLNKEEADEVLEHQEWYCKQFGAKDMEVIGNDNT